MYTFYTIKPTCKIWLYFVILYSLHLFHTYLKLSHVKASIQLLHASKKLNFVRDFKISLLQPRGHSHFGGAAYVGLLRPHFQHRCHPITQYFYWKLMALTQWPPSFSFNLSPKACNYFQFQQHIGYFKWFCAQSSCLKFERQHKLLLWDWMHWKTKNYILWFSPNAPIILDQNEVFHSMTPYFFPIFLSPDAPACENRCPIIPISYMSAPPPCIRASKQNSTSPPPSHSLKKKKSENNVFFWQNAY